MNPSTQIQTAHQKGLMRLGDKVRLSDKHRKFLSLACGVEVKPDTVEDYNACIQYIEDQCESDDSPESRLLAAIVADSKLS